MAKNDRALAYVQTCRSRAHPNHGFKLQLLKLGSYLARGVPPKDWIQAPETLYDVLSSVLPYMKEAYGVNYDKQQEIQRYVSRHAITPASIVLDFLFA